MNLGEAMQVTRQNVFYTQDDFVKKLDVALSTVNHWKLNKARPNMRVMKSIRTFCEE